MVLLRKHDIKKPSSIKIKITGNSKDEKKGKVRYKIGKKWALTHEEYQRTRKNGEGYYGTNQKQQWGMNNRKITASDRHVKVGTVCLWSNLNIYTHTQSFQKC